MDEYGATLAIVLACVTLAVCFLCACSCVFLLCCVFKFLDLYFYEGEFSEKEMTDDEEEEYVFEIVMQNFNKRSKEKSLNMDILGMFHPSDERASSSAIN